MAVCQSSNFRRSRSIGSTQTSELMATVSSPAYSVVPGARMDVPTGSKVEDLAGNVTIEVMATPEKVSGT
jgi:hypothetical protein